jgi:hypothetical protein
MADTTNTAPELRMDAYYYGFEPTGVREIDLILSAVACAGKAFHETADWRDDARPYDGHIGNTPVEWIQNAANAAADEVRAAQAAAQAPAEPVDDSALEGMARAEFEAAMSFGVSLDNFLRLARSVRARSAVPDNARNPLQANPEAWIQVSQRLPERDGQEVFVHAPGAMDCDRWPATWSADHQNFVAGGGWFEQDEVTHWMPAPQAPSGTAGTTGSSLQVRDFYASDRAPTGITVPAGTTGAAQPDEQLEAARFIDALRYRWLRNRAVNFGRDDDKATPWVVRGTRAEDAEPCQGDELDAAVDAARASA